LLTENLSTFARGTLVQLVLAGRWIDIAVIHVSLEDVKIGLWGAAVVDLCLGLVICLEAGTLDRRAASTYSLGRRSRALNDFRTTTNSLTLAISINHRLVAGGSATSFSLDLYFRVGFIFDGTCSNIRSLAAATIFSFGGLNAWVVDNSFFGVGWTTTAFAGLNLSSDLSDGVVFDFLDDRHRELVYSFQFWIGGTSIVLVERRGGQVVVKLGSTLPR
jgi:hypothetical protein